MVTPRSLSIITRLINYVLRRKQVSVALEVATKELGYKELRPNQEAAIRNFLGVVCESFYGCWKTPLLLFTSKSVR